MYFDACSIPHYVLVTVQRSTTVFSCVKRDGRNIEIGVYHRICHVAIHIHSIVALSSTRCSYWTPKTVIHSSSTKAQSTSNHNQPRSLTLPYPSKPSSSLLSPRSSVLRSTTAIVVVRGAIRIGIIIAPIRVRVVIGIAIGRLGIARGIIAAAVMIALIDISN